MIVVADTSPLNYLIVIEEIEILAKMYGRVVIPRAVRKELLSPSAPEMVRNWIGQLPPWVEVHTAVNVADPSLAGWTRASAMRSCWHGNSAQNN